MKFQNERQRVLFEDVKTLDAMDRLARRTEDPENAWYCPTKEN